MTVAAIKRSKTGRGRRRALQRDSERTRRALVTEAARVFNETGYLGTDTNRIARAAGYAPATFYKHFEDKRAIFLEAYRLWVDSEWDAISRIVTRGGSRRQTIQRLTNAILNHHQRWGGFRAALVGLAAVDPEVARFRIDSRRRQMNWLENLLGELGAPSADASTRLTALLTFERLCDAVAWGESAKLGVKRSDIVAELRRMLAGLVGMC